MGYECPKCGTGATIIDSSKESCIVCNLAVENCSVCKKASYCDNAEPEVACQNGQFEFSYEAERALYKRYAAVKCPNCLKNGFVEDDGVCYLCDYDANNDPNNWTNESRPEQYYSTEDETWVDVQDITNGDYLNK